MACGLVGDAGVPDYYYVPWIGAGPVDDAPQWSGIGPAMLVWQVALAGPSVVVVVVESKAPPLDCVGLHGRTGSRHDWQKLLMHEL